MEDVWLGVGVAVAEECEHSSRAPSGQYISAMPTHWGKTEARTGCSRSLDRHSNSLGFRNASEQMCR